MYQVLQGDATKPEGLGDKNIIIPHVCNDINAWGAGFVLALNKAFGPKAKESYHFWGDTVDWLSNEADVKIVSPVKHQFMLGATQFVRVQPKLVIANMVAQSGTGKGIDGRPPIRYGALAFCMDAVAVKAAQFKAEIHCPKFGSDLAGGDFKIIEQMIKEIWVDSGIDVTVYEWKP